MVANLVRGKINILLISETKINEPFPTPQFFISGYSLTSRILCSQQILANIESIFVEIYKKKWLLGGTYKPMQKYDFKSR